VPVNLRGKVEGIGAGSVGNNISVVNCTYELQSDKMQHLATRIHEEMRTKITEDAALQALRFANMSRDRCAFFQCRHLKRETPGVITQWNYQVTTPFLEVDFGVGKPTRAHPWSCEPVKIMKGLHGGIDVMIWKGSWGIASWAKDKYGALRKGIALGQILLVGAFLLLRRLRTRRCLASASASLAASAVLKSLLNKAHAQYVEACFQALEEHPKLRAFTEQVDMSACGGA